MLRETELLLPEGGQAESLLDVFADNDTDGRNSLIEDFLVVFACSSRELAIRYDGEPSDSLSKSVMMTFEGVLADQLVEFKACKFEAALGAAQGVL